MNLIVEWKDKNTLGKAVISVPDKTLSKKNYVAKMQEFVLVVSELNDNLARQGYEVVRRIEE